MKDYILVVLHKTDESFGYYDVSSGEQIHLVETRPFPHEVCLSPDREKLYIAEMGVRGVESQGDGGNTVAVYDTKSRELLSTISTGKYDRPHGVATHENGKLFVTSESTKFLLIYDIESEELLHQVFLDQEIAHMVNVAPDGKTAYTANIGSNTITAVDVENGQVIKHIDVLERPEGMVFSPGGDLIYVVNRESRAVAVVDAAAGEMVDTITTGEGPVRIVITPDGTQLAIPLFHSDAVQIVDTESREVTHTVNVGKQPAGTAISRDGKLVFMSCEEESAVYVFDMESIEIIKKISTDEGCDAMVCLDADEVL
ncbi:MAG: beta-propeller fold lactonase family protein [Candidatus Marinimicrobia bacterium]|nr:beta-propeller fold lactonase family protein [Candidatus Neomarinimicrobiota bacterium]